MKNDNLESKLTPAAKEVLEELVGDYKLQLLREANKSASDVTGEVREVSVRDLFDSLQKIESYGSNKKTKLFEKFLITYAFLGIIMVLVVSIMAQLGILSIYATGSFVLIGALLAFTSLCMYYLSVKRVISIGSITVSKRDVTQEAKDYSMLFIMKWRELEILSREVVSYYIGESNIDNISVRDLLNNLLKFEVITPSESISYLKLLEKRNSLVHTNTLEMSATEYAELENIANLLIKKFSTVQMR